MSGALSFGAFIAGGLQLVVTFGCVVAAAVLSARRWWPDLHGVVLAVALSTLTITGMLVVELVPLTLGVLSRATPVIAAVALLGAVSVATRQADTAAAEPARRASRWPRTTPSVALALFGLFATSVIWLGWVEANATVPVASIDALNFHLPGVISFIRSGSLWHVTQYLTSQAQGNYPQNGDVLLLAVTLPWRSLAFVRYVDVPLLAVAGLGVYATARELGASFGPSALTALALLAIRPVLGPGLQDVMTDPCFLAGFAAGMLFLVRHGRTGARGDLILAGTGLGIALGTKWYGLTDVPALLVVWGLFAWRRQGRLGGVLRDGAIIVAFSALTGGIWLVRNLVLTGNPVFDYRLSVFGLTIFPAPPDTLRTRIGFSLAHYAGNFGVLRRYVWPVFRQDFGITGLLIGLGAVIALVKPRQIPGRLGWSRGSVSDRHERADDRILMLAAAALLCAIAYAITPYSAQGLPGAPTLVAANTRYGVPALVLAAPLLAVSISRTRYLRLPVELLLLVTLLVDLHRYVWPGTRRTVIAAVVVLLVIAAFQVLRMTRFRLRLRPARSAAVVLCGCAVALAAYHFQRVLALRPYTPDDPTIDYVLARAPTGARIGVTGIWSAYGLGPVAPLFGPRFGNSVGYVGPFREHRLEQYENESSFDAALRRERYPLLEIGTGIPALANPPQLRWAQAAGYVVVTRSSRLILMRASA